MRRSLVSPGGAPVHSQGGKAPGTTAKLPFLTVAPADSTRPDGAHSLRPNRANEHKFPSLKPLLILPPID